VHSPRRKKLTEGTRDGNRRRIPWCDGIPADATAALVRLMQTIVERTLEPSRVRKF
jgi:hypothetical protein